MSSEEKKYKFPADIQAKIDRKEKLTKAEVSIVRSINAKNGAERRKREGTCRGGRPRIAEGNAVPVKTMTLRERSYNKIRKYAFDANITIIEQMEKILEVYDQYMSGKAVRRVACNSDGLPEIVIKVRRRMIRGIKTVDDRNELEALQAELSELILSGLVESKYSDLCKYNPTK